MPSYDTLYTVSYKDHYIHARTNRDTEREEFTTSLHGKRVFETMRGAKQGVTLRAGAQQAEEAKPATTADGKKLWCAMVSHVAQPGTQLAFFHQAKEPVDFLIKDRFKEAAKPRELEIDALFNVTHSLTVDPTSKLAFEQGLAGLAAAGWAKPEPSVKEAELWCAMVAHESTPGIKLSFFHQAGEPSDAAIFARYADFQASELEVFGVFSVSHILRDDAADRAAVIASLQAPALEAAPEAAPARRKPQP